MSPSCPVESEVKNMICEGSEGLDCNLTAGVSMAVILNYVKSCRGGASELCYRAFYSFCGCISRKDMLINTRN